MSLQVSNKKLLIDIQCIPCITYIKLLIDYPEWVFDIFLYHEKKSYSNRYYVAGPNGTILLSIPLEKGKRQRTREKDVLIDQRENWQARQWKTLVSAYRRSPWFEYYEDELRMFFEKPYRFLLDWNLDWLQWMSQVLGFTQPFQLTDHFVSPEEAIEYADYRHKIEPPPASISDPGIRYRQVFEERTGFLPDLSIFDLICCEGKHAAKILRSEPSR
ncbi:MAG: WbqC family protein [Thermoflavifilum sp.]|nr:WbqC family protein [Thermoflavifilum sp.]